MSYEWYTAISLVKILAAFLFFFVYLPKKIFPQRSDAFLIERFFENFVIMASSGIILVHLLALLKIYSILSLLLCYLAIYGFVFWRRHPAGFGERLRPLWIQKVTFAFDVLDQVVDLKASARQAWRAKRRRWAALLSRRADRVHFLLFGAILLYSAGLRYADAFRSAPFAFSDSYTHLLMMRSLEAGSPYPPEYFQYYPKGFHAFLAILHGLTRLDGAITMRLAGPLVGVLLVLAVYYAGRKLTGNREAALIGMSIFGAFVFLLKLLGASFSEEGLSLNPAPFGAALLRQTAPLSEEFAVVFLVPAFFAAYSFITEKRPQSLVVYGLASIAIFTTNPLVGLAFGFGMATMIILALVLRTFCWESFWKLGMASFAAGVIGNLQILLAWRSRALQKTAEGYFTQWLTAYEAYPISLEILTSSTIGLLFLVGGLLVPRGKALKLLWAFFGMYLLVLVFLGVAMHFGIVYLIPPDRVEHYRGFILCAALTGVYSLVLWQPFGRWHRRIGSLHQAVVGLSLIALAGFGLPRGIPSPPTYEYDALARMSYAIKRSFPPLEWTIVSTVEDYSKLLDDKGWHLNIQDFLDRHSPYENTLSIPTPYVFLFVEKKPFPRSSSSDLNEPGVRPDLQRRLREWANIYNLRNTNMSIYYEDWDVIVYLIEQNRGPNRLQAHTKVKPLPQLAMRAFE